MATYAELMVPQDQGRLLMSTLRNFVQAMGGD
jgi:hypothetical protein